MAPGYLQVLRPLAVVDPTHLKAPFLITENTLAVNCVLWLNSTCSIYLQHVLLGTEP